MLADDSLIMTADDSLPETADDSMTALPMTADDHSLPMTDYKLANDS